MDFKPMKKDGKPDESGHFPWESPGLRARREEARKAGKPRTAEGVTPITWGGAASSAGMIARDAPKVAVEPRAESVVSTPLAGFTRVGAVTGDKNWRDNNSPAAEGGCRHFQRIGTGTWPTLRVTCHDCGVIL